jgi:hypothetical protein
MRKTSIDPKAARTIIPAILAGVLLLGPSATATGAEDEESGSTYARVRHVEGRLSVQTADGEVSDATLNTPIAPGDRVRALEGRAEIELADGSVIWLEEGAHLDLRTLADVDNRYERSNVLALGEGSIRINAVEPEEKDKVFRIDTEAGSVYLLSGGSFRIDAGGNLATVSSLRGVAEVSGDAGSELVRTGERASVHAGRAPSDPRPFNTLRLDDFDQFCEDRLAVYVGDDVDEESEEVEEVLPYEVRPYYRELSVYGGWRHLPTYGWVWRPAYYGSWGPYVNGYWTWCPTGWVWVSHDVWGWAPYRYGRWDFVFDVGWVWIPGRIWSGAWVSFAVGPTHIGWCPLNYYNVPVFHRGRLNTGVGVALGKLNPRGWRFAPVGRFNDRRMARVAVRPDRLPGGSDLVLSGRLPRFNPREIAERPDRGRRFVETVRATRAPLAGVAVVSEAPKPFKDLERAPAGNRSRDNVTRGRPRHGQAGPRTIQEPQRRSGPERPDNGTRKGPPERIGRPQPRPETAGPTPERGRREDRPALRPNGSPAPRARRPVQTERRGGRPGGGPERAPDAAESKRDGRQSGSGVERRPGHVVDRLFDKARRERVQQPSGSKVESPRGGAGRERVRSGGRTSGGESKPPAKQAPPPKRGEGKKKDR